MEKLKLKVLIYLISVFTLLYSDEFTFNELASLVSADLGKNIYLDKDIEDYSVEFNIADYQKKGEITSFFNTVLFDNDMYLKYNNHLKYYTVARRTKKRKILDPISIPASVDTRYYYTYKIKNITNKDVVKTMSIFPKSQFVYLEQSDMISYSCTKSQHKQIERMLSAADNKSKEGVIKITLFSTKKDKIKSFGSNIRKMTFSLDSSFDKLFNNLLSSSSPASLVVEKSLNVGFTLFALEGHGLVEIFQEPTIRISNGKESIVKSGLNIGYLESTMMVREDQQIVTDQIRYRDVGIQLKILPKIKNDWVYLELDLISEELISLEDNIPLTQKISYKSSVTVRRGKPLLLTGIKKTSVQFEKDGVPFLKDIYLIGELFKKEIRTSDEQNINILIELL